MWRQSLFQNLYIWQEAKDLFVLLYWIFDKRNFKDYYFADQLLRACLSISNNIAEWSERSTKKQEKLFFGYAKGSCWEVKSMLVIAKSLWFIEEETQSECMKHLNRISAWLYTIISKK